MKNSHIEEHPTPPSLEKPEEMAPSSLLERLMRRRGLVLGLVIAGLALFLISGALLWGLTDHGAIWWGWRTSVAPAPALTLTPPPSLEELAEQHPELANLLNDPALGSVYKQFLVAYEEGGAEAAEALARKRGLLTDRDEIRITLIVDDVEHVPPIVEELRKTGITVEGSYRTKINVGVPLALIERLSEEESTEALFQQLTQIEHIIRLELPLPNQPGRTPQIEGEGVSLTGAKRWHEANVTGEGIRVGVLDMGFDGYRDLLGSDLPIQVTAKSFAYGEEPDTSGEPHGTACAEIVHEMAPGAELLLAHYDGTTVSKGQAVDWLLEQGVDIISHSAGSVMGPMDGSGENARLVDEVTAQGILWINSIGNEAQRHYRGVFNDANGNSFHEFPNGEEKIALWPYGHQMTVVLNWDDWENVTQDYDFFVYDDEGDLIASAEDTQDGSPGQSAAEGLIIYDLTESVYYLSIKAFETTHNATLDLYTPNAALEFPVAEHSLNTPADARGSLTVGATEYKDDALASYSSQGPTNDGRIKPELSAPAGVSGVTYGSEGFDGTSASTPHVAGAAALIWSAFPDFDRQRVNDYLQSQALDLGPEGPDSQYGFGRLQLPAAPGGIAEETEPTPAPALPTVPPAPTLVPQPTEVAALPPEQRPQPSPSTPSEGSVPLLLVGLGATGLCGAAAVLIGGVLLLTIWRRSSSTRTAPPIPQVSPPPSPPPPPPAPSVGTYGFLTHPSWAPIALQPGQTTLGRADENDLVLESPQVSRHHARITCSEGTCRIEDLGSSNGTFINGRRVTQAPLSPGDQLRIGDQTFTYQLTDRAEVEEAWLDLNGTRYPLTATIIAIGRVSDSDIRLSDDLVSRRHARIERHEKQFTLIDLGSTNGTFVNSQRINQQILHDGDEIRIGHQTLRFHRPA